MVQSLDLTLGEQTVTANFDSTGGAQAYQDVVVSNLDLNAGSQELRLDMKSNAFQLNYIELRPKTIVVVDEDATSANSELKIRQSWLNNLIVRTQLTLLLPIVDNVAVDAATIDANDITVTCPWQYRTSCYFS